ncbi:flagellar hook-length control protein FliK [Pseudobutyrivibrio xylanivorans]|uniref:Flagellar hook-length control protein FliK n=1 Tax=Pseudobutyrivibrio xylanivorans DSM 14809 TaxID=1123012 RepID=A0A1M6EKS7_PSEXY|nr:flagellar hook-length control protein FliK [Pseudobutyrivibrio xylanivorans]SHI85850.1 flagellar hook-length control protein FliK [Pseudobutyrivibrio xylanivorans DSM 14809]
MTSSNVSNMLVQIGQIDVSMTSDKSTNNVDAGLFEKTLKGVADKVPSVGSDINSALPQKQGEKKPVSVDSSTTSVRTTKQEEQPLTEKTEVAEKIETVVEEVKEVIKDQLDVTEEDIEKAMENLGLTFIDLLNPQSLAQLVSELTGETESITLVLSDDFAEILEKATDLSNQLFEETNNSFVQLKELVAQIDKTEMQIDEVVQTIEEVEIPEISQPEIVAEEEEMPVQEVAQQPTVQVVQEEVKPVEKHEEPVIEEPTPVIDSAEDLKVDEEQQKQQNNQPEDENKEENTQSNFKMPEVKQNESRIVREDGILPPQQNVQLQYVPENSAVTLPTGEMVKSEDIVNQLVEQAKVMTDSESTTMEMTLNPEGLGKIYLEVTQRGSEITAKIFTENDAVKAALESQMAALRTEMNQSSTKVTSIEVSVGTHEFERNLDENGRDDSRNQEQHSEQSARRSTRIHLNSLDDLSGLMSEEDVLIAQMMKDNGGTLDFMA